MFLHIVLFRPKPEVSKADREAMFAALAVAATEIPSVRRFHLGNRVTHGAAYERTMPQDFPFVAIVEFDDVAGLQAYLTHPKHAKLGELFHQLQEATLVYDYAMEQPLPFRSR